MSDEYEQIRSLPFPAKALSENMKKMWAEKRLRKKSKGL